MPQPTDLIPVVRPVSRGPGIVEYSAPSRAARDLAGVGINPRPIETLMHDPWPKIRVILVPPQCVGLKLPSFFL